LAFDNEYAAIAQNAVGVLCGTLIEFQDRFMILRVADSGYTVVLIVSLEVLMTLVCCPPGVCI